jgi:hypothetical protein
LGAIEFFEQNVKAIAPAACHQNARRFSVDRFHREIANAFDTAWKMHHK